MGERARLPATEVTASRHAAIDAASIVRDGTRSGGSPLPPATRAKMEARFGHDFSQVRVFADSAAGQSADALAAKAYTVGSDIVFQPDEYSPHAPDGEELLVHELTHVVQQGSAAGGAATRGDLEVSQPGDPAEREADAIADNVNGGATADVEAVAGDTEVHRWPWDDGGGSSGGGGDSGSGGGGGVLDSLGSTASGAWNATKSAAAGAYDYYEKSTDFKSGLGLMDQGIDWVEKKNAEGAQKGADELKGIPVLEQLGQASAFLSTQTVDLAGGVAKGVGDIAGGIGNAFFHPIDTLAGMEGIAEHDLPMVGSVLKAGHGLYDLAANTDGKGGGQYGDSLGDLANHLFNPLQQAEDDQKFNSDLMRGIVAPGTKDWNEAIQRVKDNPMDTLGRAATNVAPMLMGLGEADAAEGAEAAQAGKPPVPVDTPPPIDTPPPSADVPPSTLKTPYAPPGVPEPPAFDPDIPVTPDADPSVPKPAAPDAPADPNAPNLDRPSQRPSYEPTGSRGDWAHNPGEDLGDNPPSSPPGFEGQPRPYPAPLNPQPLPPEAPSIGPVPDPATLPPERPPNTLIEEPSSGRASGPTVVNPNAEPVVVNPTHPIYPDAGAPTVPVPELTAPPDTIPGGPEFPRPTGEPIEPQPIPKLPGGPKEGPPIPREEPPSGPVDTARQPMDIPGIPAEEPLPSTQPEGPVTQPAPPSSESQVPTLPGLGGMPAIPRGFDPGGVIQLLLDTPGGGTVVQKLQELGMPIRLT